MKQIFTILGIILSIGLYSQNSDERIISLLKQKYKLTEFDRPTEIIRFNKDTILIAGYLSNSNNDDFLIYNTNNSKNVSDTIEDFRDILMNYGPKKNIVYKTTDGGINWKRISFKGNAWIHCAYNTNEGRIWMGGTDKFIHYSSNYGESWIKKPVPFKPADWIMSIFMVDSLYGIAGGFSNELSITQNNWITTEQVQTPLNQNKYKTFQKSTNDRIEKLAILDSFILINQHNHIYYSIVNNINWIKFNIPVVDFVVNVRKKELDLQSLNGKHFVLSSVLKLIRTYQEELYWGEITKDSVYIETTHFLNNSIKSINLLSTKWEIFKSDDPYIQKAKFIKKGNVFYFKSKGYKNETLTFTENKLLNILKSDEINYSLDKVAQNLTFSNSDLENYIQIVEHEKANRKNDLKWGNDYSSQINIEDSLFTNYQSTITKINQDYVNFVFNQLYIPTDSLKRFLLFNNLMQNQILLTIINSNNDTLKISNENQILYSLPWTIEYKRQRISSYNPKLTEFVQSILPKSFNNFDMLLGGDLIFKLIQEKVVDELKYKNSY